MTGIDLDAVPLDEALGTCRVDFTEPEARFLSGAVVGLLDAGALSAAQRELAYNIAGRFESAISRKRIELETRYGAEGAERLAERSIEAHPDVEDIPPLEVIG